MQSNPPIKGRKLFCVTYDICTLKKNPCLALSDWKLYIYSAHHRNSHLHVYIEDQFFFPRSWIWRRPSSRGKFLCYKSCRHWARKIFSCVNILRNRKRFSKSIWPSLSGNLSQPTKHFVSFQNSFCQVAEGRNEEDDTHTHTHVAQSRWKPRMDTEKVQNQTRGHHSFPLPTQKKGLCIHFSPCFTPISVLYMLTHFS